MSVRRIRELEAGTVDGVPLQEMAAAGDVHDCRKLYFGPGDPPSHRIVFRDRGATGEIEIIEVAAVEAQRRASRRRGR